jgi:hypothetical protein
MVECKPHSRHMLAWLMDKMNPDTDGLFLAVLKAHDAGTGQVRTAYYYTGYKQHCCLGQGGGCCCK